MNAIVSMKLTPKQAGAQYMKCGSLEDEVKQLQATVQGLTDPGCVPPSWIEAEQLRQGIEEAIGMDVDNISDYLQRLLDEVVAADSLPVSVHLCNLRDEVAALKESA